jgi:hypothetical protein
MTGPTRGTKPVSHKHMFKNSKLKKIQVKKNTMCILEKSCDVENFKKSQFPSYQSHSPRAFGPEKFCLPQKFSTPLLAFFYFVFF